MDTSVLPQDQSYGQKSASESLPGYTKLPIPRKRATVLWDRSLEDVIEDDGDEMEEQCTMSTEEAVQQHEEVIIGKEEYMVCARSTSRISVALSFEAQYSPFPQFLFIVFLSFSSPLFHLNPALRV